jgi:mercuric ion binding protein
MRRHAPFPKEIEEVVMNVKKISTSFLVIAAITILVVFAFRVRLAVTADSVAVLKTTGMTCGSCSSKITRALESAKGVAVTEVDVNGGWVIVGYDMEAVKPEALAARVTSAGFASMVSEVLTPEQFRQITGRNVGQNAAATSGGCGGGCGANKPS